jgi:predicted transcriptional regulator
METLRALQSATNEWILFDQQKRFARNSHREPLHWDTLIHTLQENKSLYAGIRLHHDLKILCIDIDARETPLTEPQAREYIRIFEELLGATCIPELSKNNGLHLFFPYTGTLPEQGREKGIRKEILDIPHTIEWYWHNQAILISNKNLAPWRDWSSLSPTTAETVLKLIPRRKNKKQTQTTCPPQNEKRSPDKTQTTNRERAKEYRKSYTKRKNAWFELLPFLPELHRPLYADRIVREDDEKIFLRRPGKEKGHSAVLFKQTGVFYNFSTNWDEVGIEEAIPTESFLIRYTKKTPHEIGKTIHQFIYQLFTQNNIPIPRRKRYRYYTIRRKLIREFVIINILLKKGTATTKEIETEINQTLRYQTHHATIHKDLETLIRKQLITKIKQPNNQNLYTIQPNALTTLLHDTILSENYSTGTKLLLYTAFFNLIIPTLLTELQPLRTIHQTFNQFKRKYHQYLLAQIQKLPKRIQLIPEYQQTSTQYRGYKKQLQTNQHEKLEKKLYELVLHTNDQTKREPQPEKEGIKPPRISFIPRIAKPTPNPIPYHPRESGGSYERMRQWWEHLGNSP